MKKLLTVLILLVFAVPAYSATVYKWVDEKGVFNFTDDFRNVPSVFRNRVQKEYLEEAPPTRTKEEANSNIDNRNYGEKQLDEATANYEKAREELLQEGERLVIHRYGGKTQYQMFTEALPSITERFETYKKQMIEAKAMLDEFREGTQGTENADGKRAFSAKTDIYGRDETWWKEKARPWKEQLKDATKNYEGAFDGFAQQLERLGPFRWGGLSLTQYQMISSRLTLLSGQMERYQTQISEAKGMLARLSEEAKETKADPAWLK